MRHPTIANWAFVDWALTLAYNSRDFAALAHTDAVTRITEGHVPNAAFEGARAHFNEQELIALVFTMTTINALNRLAITMRTEVAAINRRSVRRRRPGWHPPALAVGVLATYN